MKDNLHTLAFAATLALACATMLTAANRLLKDRQQANERAEKLHNVLTVLGVDVPEDASSETLLEIADKSLREGKAGDLVYYEYTHPTEGTLRAFEFEGPGLWGPVHGLLCMRDDLATVYRVTFYKHEETPGLGGDIDTARFRERFENLPVADGGVRIVRTPTDPSDVEAISGATLTCDKVQAMINHVIARIQEQEEAIRRGGDNG